MSRWTVFVTFALGCAASHRDHEAAPYDDGHFSRVGFARLVLR